MPKIESAGLCCFWEEKMTRSRQWRAQISHRLWLSVACAFESTKLSIHFVSLSGKFVVVVGLDKVSLHIQTEPENRNNSHDDNDNGKKRNTFKRRRSGKIASVAVPNAVKLAQKLFSIFSAYIIVLSNSYYVIRMPSDIVVLSCATAVSHTHTRAFACRRSSSSPSLSFMQIQVHLFHFPFAPNRIIRWLHQLHNLS